MPPVTFVVQKMMLSAIFLSPIFLFSLKKVPRDTNTLLKLVLLSLISASQLAAVHLGLVEESSGIGSVLTYTQPLFVFCLAVPFLEEKITSLKLLGAILGFIGIVVLFVGKISVFTLNATIIMTLSGFLWAVTIVYYKRCLNKVDPLVASFFQLSLGIIPLSALTVNAFSVPMGTYLWIVLYASIGSLAIGTTLWLFLLKEEDATVLAGTSFIVPLFALLFGWEFLGERIEIGSMLGSALILMAVYLANIRPKRNKHNA